MAIEILLFSLYLFIIVSGSILLMHATTRYGIVFVRRASTVFEMWAIVAITVLVYVLCMQGWGRGWAILLGVGG